MHWQVGIGLLLALACALGASLGGLWKQRGAVQTSAVDIRHPLQSAAALFRSKWFVLGWITAAVAWLLHVGALALAPLSLGQAVISGGIVLLGLLAERFFDFKVTRRQWVGLVLLGVGMGALGATAHGDNNHSGYGILAVAIFELCAIAAGVVCALGCRRKRLRDRHGLLLGIAGGIMFGVSDISIKAVTGGHHGILGFFGPWTFFGIVGAIAGFFTTAKSLQVGEPVEVIAATTCAATLLGIVGGIVLFGDPIGSNPAMVTGRMLAFVLVIVAVALVPAPVRAQEAVRTAAEEDEPGCSVSDAEEDEYASTASGGEREAGSRAPAWAASA